MSWSALLRLSLMAIVLTAVFAVGLGLGSLGSHLSQTALVAAPQPVELHSAAEESAAASDPANWREEPILGLKFEPLTAELARAKGLSFESGAVVREVTPGGFGDRYGLRAGDVIRSLNGLPVDDAHALDALVLGLHTRGALEFSVWRDGEAIEVMVDFTADPGVLG